MFPTTFAGRNGRIKGNSVFDYVKNKIKKIYSFDRSAKTFILPVSQVNLAPHTSVASSSRLISLNSLTQITPVTETQVNAET